MNQSVLYVSSLFFFLDKRSSLLHVLFQRVFESTFVGRRSIVKERFSKKYRHPILDAKLTLKRLNAVRFFPLHHLCLNLERKVEVNQ